MASPPHRRPAPLKVSAAYGRALLHRFGISKTARAALLEGIGLDEGALGVAGAEIPLPALMALVANVARMHGEDWPLHTAQVWSNAMQGALDVATRSAPTLGDALRVLARYGHVRAPYLVVRLSSFRGARVLSISGPAALNDMAWRSLAYAVALSVHAMLAQIAEGAISDARICFPWPAPAFAPQLRALVSCKIQFNAERFMIAIPASLCACASPFADLALHASAIAELEHGAQRIDGADTIVGDTTRVITGSLPERLGEEDAARMLGLSRRSLVRRLADAGVTYRWLLDRNLEERARVLLARGDLTRDDMAAALGYSDPTSFSRACRRWFRSRAA